MGGCVSAVKQEIKPKEFDKNTDTGVNSLEADLHIDPEKSKKQFDKVKGLIKSNKGSTLKCKGLSFIGEGLTGDVFCKGDFAI